MPHLDAVTVADLTAWRRLLGQALRFVLVVRPLVADKLLLSEQAEQLVDLLAALVSVLDEVLA